ncbi:MAG: hypothetical protein COC19_00735 [SAR86 cluster bacterium]|uniref:Uncharacterized protein n=1 Tax=SAR86 cluster bacterium TaxID=2030880 RepID=A0A2A4MUS2_9GAMM|nr:MAG: hypothetical protein COC19_00735 [SAR86 cluster bacterium]
MLENYISYILYAIGAVTASMVMQLISPQYFLRTFNNFEIDDEKAIFLARSAAAPIAMIGILIIWAGYDANIRVPILTAAMIGKAAFVGVILMKLKTIAKGFLFTAIFDSISVVIFASYLISRI